MIKTATITKVMSLFFTCRFYDRSTDSISFRHRLIFSCRLPLKSLLIIELPGSIILKTFAFAFLYKIRHLHSKRFSILIMYIISFIDSFSMFLKKMINFSVTGKTKSIILIILTYTPYGYIIIMIKCEREDCDER